MSEAAGHEMPFLDHLEELRKRLFWIAGAIIIGVVVGFTLLSKLDIIRLLERPILPLLHGQKLIYTHPGTSFHILLNASLVLGLILAAPVIVGQIWGFLAPALYAHEKRVVIPVLIAIVALFLAGVALSYFVVLPLTLQFLMSIESTALTPLIRRRSTSTSRSACALHSASCSRFRSRFSPSPRSAWSLRNSCRSTEGTRSWCA